MSIHGPPGANMGIPAFCVRCIELPMDTEQDVQHKLVTIMILMILMVANAYTLLRDDVRGVPFSMFSACLAGGSYLVLLLWLAISRKLSPAFVRVFAVTYTFHIITMDIGSAVVQVAVWPMFVLLVDFLLLIRAPRGLAQLVVGVFCVYLTVALLEETIRFGLFDLPGLWPVDRRCGVCTCETPPCAREDWSLFVLMFFIRVGSTLIDFGLTRAFAERSQRALDRDEHTIRVTHRMCASLARFDLDGVESLLAREEAVLPQALHRSFTQLTYNLGAYRPYLPQSCFPEVADLAHLSMTDVVSHCGGDGDKLFVGTSDDSDPSRSETMSSVPHDAWSVDSPTPRGRQISAGRTPLTPLQALPNDDSDASAGTPRSCQSKNARFTRFPVHGNTVHTPSLAVTTQSQPADSHVESMSSVSVQTAPKPQFLADRERDQSRSALSLLGSNSPLDGSLGGGEGLRVPSGGGAGGSPSTPTAERVPRHAAQKMLREGLRASYLAQTNLTLLYVSLRSRGRQDLDMRGADSAAYTTLHEAFLREVLRAVSLARGVVDTFVGNTVVGTYNASRSAPRHAVMAIQTLEQILSQADHGYAEHLGGHTQLCVSGAVATGAGVVGVLGTDAMRRPTVLGHLPRMVARMAKVGVLRRYGALVNDRAYSDAAVEYPMRVVLDVAVLGEHGVLEDPVGDGGTEGEPRERPSGRAHTLLYELLIRPAGSISASHQTGVEWMYAIQQSPGVRWDTYNEEGRRFVRSAATHRHGSVVDVTATAALLAGIEDEHVLAAACAARVVDFTPTVRRLDSTARVSLHMHASHGDDVCSAAASSTTGSPTITLPLAQRRGSSKRAFFAQT